MQDAEKKGGLLRGLFYRTAQRAGINAIFRAVNRNKIRILALHGVADYKSMARWEPLRKQLSANRFEQCLRALVGPYTFVTMAQVRAMLSGEAPVIKNCIAVTFDDGYRNNFDVASPILRKYDVPATFYIATGFVGRGTPFWFDRLDYILQEASGPGTLLELDGETFDFTRTDRRSLERSYKLLREHLKSRYVSEREFVGIVERIASDLETKAGVSLVDHLDTDPWAGIVDIEGLQEIASDPLIYIGSHTVGHLRLSCADPNHVDLELKESKAQLEQWIRKPCEHFAYPNGDNDDYARSAVEKAGYVTAVTSATGMNEVGDNLFALRRLHVGADIEVSELLARTSGLEASVITAKAFLRRLRSLLRRLPRCAKIVGN